MEAGRDPSKLTLSIEGAGILVPDETGRAAESLGRLKEMGIAHAILGVHPGHMGNAAPIIEEFAAKHLKELQA